MILVPVSDYKAFLGNFADAKTEGAVTTFTARRRTGEARRQLGQVRRHRAEQGAARQEARRAEARRAWPPRKRKEKDAFIFANIPALSRDGLPHLERGPHGGHRRRSSSELGSDEHAKQFAGVAKAGLNQILNIAEGFLRDATAASLSLHLNDQGLQTTLMAEFKPDSYGGKMAAQFKNTDQPLMAGLPRAASTSPPAGWSTPPR